MKHWTQKQEQALLTSLSQGVPRAIAVRLVGLGLSTFYERMREGQDPASPFAAFREKVQQAEAKWVDTAVKRVMRASSKEWKAAAFMLKSRVKEFQDRKESKVKVDGSVDLRSDDIRDAVLAAIKSDPGRGSNSDKE